MAIEPGMQEETADRGIPNVNVRRSGAPPAVKIIVLMAVVLAALGGGALVLVKKFQADRAANKQPEIKAQTVSKLPELDPSAIAGSGTPLPEEEEAVDAASGQQTPAPPASTGTAPAGAVVPALTPAQIEAEAIVARRNGSPLLAYGEAAPAPPATSAQEAQGVARAIPTAMPSRVSWPPQQAQPAAAAPGGLEAALKGVDLSANSAKVLQDQNMTLTQASIIPCVLNTAIDSTLPGMVSCTVSSNVYSTNGRVVLIERGSKLVGQYQNAVKQGMKRVFVLWTRVETPAGVTIALDSPAADGLGRSGVPGHVSNHFWQRFGAGLLLSLVDDAVQYSVDSQSSRDSTEEAKFTFSSTGQAGRNAASIAVENSVGIPPTISVAQGARLNVFVARDLYFGNVYGLRTAI